jgi:hypothetical protein
MMNTLLQSKDFILSKDTCNLEPSDKVYYDYYFYRVDMPGNDVFYDIKLITEINSWLYDNFSYQEFKPKFSSKNFRVYFRNKDALNKFLDVYGTHVIKVFGPVTETHFNVLIKKDPSRYKIKNIFRPKLFYGKYNVKLSIHNMNTGSEYTDTIKNFIEYIDNNFENKQWYSNYVTNYSYFSNYLYCSKEEFDEHVPFLKLCYDDIIQQIEYIERI